MSLEDQQRTVALAEEIKGSELTRQQRYILCCACDHASRSGVLIQSREALSLFLALVDYLKEK